MNLSQFYLYLVRCSQQLAAAMAFYTCLPIPEGWKLSFERLARWAPLLGLLIGGLLSGADLLGQYAGMPTLTRAAVIPLLWVWLTGGLHLDGAMDAADGLAVQNPERRLAAMADSATGAFGAMAAIAILLLKTAALHDLTEMRWLAIAAAAGWGRWGQVVAIAWYPYLKPTGKGAFHKVNMQPLPDILLGSAVMLGLSLGFICFHPHLWIIGIEVAVAGAAIAISVGAWFYKQFGGHTGDTYGAVVEWTEALLLCLFAAVF